MTNQNRKDHLGVDQNVACRAAGVAGRAMGVVRSAVGVDGGTKGGGD